MYKSKVRAWAIAAVVLLVGLFGSSAHAASTPPSGPPVPIPAAAPGGPANIFYGGINPAAAPNAPVVVFVHGLGANATYWFTNGNLMYQYVYNAGYRSAYVSLNADNSNNHAPIAQNATTMQGLMPTILAHFGVQQVHIVAHSKGGLDTQVAMLDPGFRSDIKSMFLIACPNQGTALADWAFGSGYKIANLFGFTTPGLYDLRPEHVAQLRAQLDPVFETAGIQFWYIEGTSYTGQQDLFYHITGPILKSLTNGVPNDGLVATTEVTLPDSYADDLGGVAVDHTHIAFGQEAWPYVYGRIQGMEDRLSGWQRIASGGLGDDENTWVWSQTWFNGNLYIGTGRQINCMVTYASALGSGLSLYPPEGNDCPIDPTQLGTGAEIWRYTPQTKTWTRVYKAPQTIPIGNDANGNPAFSAISVGFRGMDVYTESDGTQALYVGGVSAASIYGNWPQYPYENNTFPPPIILRSTDGTNFTPLPEDPGTFLGDIEQTQTDIQVCSFRSIVAANGQMFVAVTDFRGQGFIMASTNPAAGDNAFQRVSPAPAFPNFAVWILANYNNALYVGAGDRENDLGYSVYYTTDGPGSPTPYNFVPVIMDGGWQPDENLRSPTTLTMHVWTEPPPPLGDGIQHLYCGTDRKIEIVRVNPDNSWDLVMGQPRNTPDGYKAPLSGIGYYFDNDFNGHIWQMQDATWNQIPGGSVPSGLHAGTWDWSILLRNSSFTGMPTTDETGFDFFDSPDGIHWYVVAKNGLGDGLNMGGRSGNFNHFGIFWGTARPTGGTQEWQDPSILDLNNDGIISMADANVIQAAMGQTATGFDPRDVNGNGVIDPQDIQYLESQCTFPNCSDIPPPGINWTPPAPVFDNYGGTQYLESATQEAVGMQASLTWPAQPNAVRYHVYRYTSTPPLQLLLNGFPSVQLQISPTFTINVPQDFTSGLLTPVCGTPDAGETLEWFCEMSDAFTTSSNTKTPPGSLAYVGFPAAVEEVAQVMASTTATPSYVETLPTNIQSLYFIRSEDANGNLSQASNIVGAPSFNQQTPLQ